MPSLSAAREFNAAWSPSYLPVIVVFGGTSGIGKAMVQVLARITKGKARIIVVGRNQEAADALIASLPTPAESTPGAGYEFVRCDVSVMKNIRDFGRVLREEKGVEKINYLVLSAGILNFGGRKDTEDGLDVKMALGFYSRFAIIQELLPLLQAAEAREGEDVGVLTVMNAGESKIKVDFSDLAFEKKYSTVKAIMSNMAYNDLMVQAFAERNPGITFTHIYPGAVYTEIFGFGKLAKAILGPIFRLALTSPEDCGEWMVYGLLNGKGGGMKRRRQHGDEVGMLNFPDATEDEKKVFWEHAVEKTKGKT